MGTALQRSPSEVSNFNRTEGQGGEWGYWGRSLKVLGDRVSPFLCSVLPLLFLERWTLTAWGCHTCNVNFPGDGSSARWGGKIRQGDGRRKGWLRGRGSEEGKIRKGMRMGLERVKKKIITVSVEMKPDLEKLRGCDQGWLQVGFCHGVAASLRALSANLGAGERAAQAELGAARRALSAVLLRSGVLRSSLHPAPSSQYLSRRPQAGPRLLLPPFPSSRLLLSPTFFPSPPDFSLPWK